MCVCRLGCLLSSDPSQSDSNSKDFWFNMQALTTYLRKASDQNPSASYYNVDILKYQVSVIPQPNPDEYAVVKECSPKTRFTLSFSHSRQKENLTVVLAHSPQIMHMSHSPEVKSFLKQTQAITSKWIIHIFMLVVHQQSCGLYSPTGQIPDPSDLRAEKLPITEAASVDMNNSEDLFCCFLCGLY